MTTPLSLPTSALDVQSALDTSKLKGPDRLHKAAQQFESLMISEMMKAAKADSEDGWLGSGDSSGSDSALEMAQSQFAEALSSGKGLGLASVIERSMASRMNESTTPPGGEASANALVK